MRANKITRRTVTPFRSLILPALRSLVILSEAKDLAGPAQRSFASLRMTCRISKCLIGLYILATS